MSAIIDLLVAIYKKIGLVGVIILLLLCLIGYGYMTIKHDEEKIVELNTTIQLQNKSIEEAGKKKKELQDMLDKAADSNQVLIDQTEDLLRKLNAKPLATTCDGSMEEVKESARQNAEEWNMKK